MKGWTFIAALACALSACAVDFFAPAPDAGANYAADKVYPSGRLFPIAGYSSPSAKLLRTMGFSVAGPVYGGHEAMKKWAAEALTENFPVIWQFEVDYEGKPISMETLEELAKAKKQLDLEQLKANARNRVAEAIAASNDNILLWAIHPEELRHWRPLEMTFLATVADEIRSADPKKRPVWMYQPGHYGYESMAKYTSILDVIGQGFYPHAGASNRVWQRMWAENLMRAAKEANRPAIAVTEMYVQPKDEELDMIPVWVHHDVWLSLIYGCEGILVFSFATRKNFDAHGNYFFAYADVAQELNGKPKLGEVLLFGVDEKDLSFTVTEGDKEAVYDNKYKKNDVHTYPTIVWRDMRHATGRYCFAVASSATPIKAELTGLPKVPVAVFDAASGKQLGTTADGTFPLEFGPWGVKLLRFAPANK
ncbi:MAG: hypothetical protein GX927_04425 [Lentisphaerae bacterium]|jgi:hypothetical protein|nr:hypothetical protein [Lentisphaerota bacterium]